MIEGGPGGIITGTFAHQEGWAWDLKVSGSSEVIGVTPSHPFRSVDRNDWIPAGELRKGERLLAADGSPPAVESFTPRPELEPVYNLEIEGDHCYRVGEQGLLVHNASAGDAFEEHARQVLGGKKEDLPYDDEGHLQDIDVSTSRFLGQAKDIDPCAPEEHWPVGRPPGNLVKQLKRTKLAADRVKKQVCLILPFALSVERQEQLKMEIPGLLFAVVPFPRNTGN